jgi:hypothetical protein
MARGQWWTLAAGLHYIPAAPGRQEGFEGRGSGNRNPVHGGNTMPKAKGRKAAAKHLHKGKKLEAQKPLKGAGKVEYMKYDLNDVLISGIQHS